VIKKKTKILLFLLVWLLPEFALAQSIEIVEADKEIVGTIGSELNAHLKIRNRSDHPILLKVRRVENQISTGETSFFCWGNDCFDKEVELLPSSIILQPGQTTSKFTSTLIAGITEGHSNVKYQFYDRNNPDDFVEEEVFYKIVEKKSTATLLKNKNIHISNIYPNPVKDFAVIDYNILDDEKEIKIVVHNVLGGSVGEYQLSVFENSVVINTEDLSPGVYFYSVYIDNDNAITKKFILKR
jgi:hypothetical protein